MEGAKVTEQTKYFGTGTVADGNRILPQSQEKCILGTHTGEDEV